MEAAASIYKLHFHSASPGILEGRRRRETDQELARRLRHSQIPRDRDRDRAFNPDFVRRHIQGAVPNGICHVRAHLFISIYSYDIQDGGMFVCVHATNHVHMRPMPLRLHALHASVFTIKMKRHTDELESTNPTLRGSTPAPTSIMYSIP